MRLDRDVERFLRHYKSGFQRLRQRHCTLHCARNNSTGRSGTLTIAGLTFVVEQQASSISGLNLVGSMPHIAAEENWTTTFTLVNKGGSSQQARLSIFGDAGDPTGNGPFTLPLTFPQQSAGDGAFLAASLDRTLSGNASLIMNTAGLQTPPVLVGSAQLAATGAVDGFAIFHLIPGAQEAVVPMETRNASSYLLAFDNTGGVVLGVAVENISAQSANIGVVIRDETGAIISNGTVVALAGNGHTSFVLSSLYPATSGKRGTIEFDTPAGGHISVLGIRTTPLGSSTTLTTIPALANVGNDGRFHCSHRHRQRLANNLRAGEHRNRDGACASVVLRRQWQSVIAASIISTNRREFHCFRSESNASGRGHADRAKYRAGVGPGSHGGLGATLRRCKRGRVCDFSLQPQWPGGGGASREPWR